MAEERFTFFYRASSPFSQFHSSKFKASPLFPQREGTDEPLKQVEFVHCEQWMMYNKAKLFGDEGTAKKILETGEPLKCKALGRQVKNFDQKIWEKHNKEIILEGNRHKFAQNPEIFQKLRETVSTALVEASPTDRIYGIGLDSDPRARSRKTWKGMNLLGETLTELREELL